MAHKEVRIPFEDIDDPQTMTPVVDRAYKELGLNLKRHEAIELIDDTDREERVLKIQPERKYFFMKGQG